MIINEDIHQVEPVLKLNIERSMFLAQETIQAISKHIMKLSKFLVVIDHQLSENEQFNMITTIAQMVKLRVHY